MCMAMTSFAAASPPLVAAFLGSLVEVVEAFTIVLAASTVRGWRPAALGTLAGLLTLGAIVATLDRKSTRLNSSHLARSRMPSSA